MDVENAPKDRATKKQKRLGNPRKRPVRWRHSLTTKKENIRYEYSQKDTRDTHKKIDTKPRV